MAQDAELKLKVSLDLGFFRQQLAGLGQAAAGYNIPVQVKFDRRSVQNELNALGANIRRRNYFLEVKTNLSKEIDNAKKLADALRALESGKTAGGATSPRGTFRQNLGKVDTGTIRNIYAAAAKEGILAFSEETNKSKSALITALNKAAQDAGQGFLNAFSAQNSAIRKAAGDYGDALLSGLRKTLRSQSPSREMFDIGEDAGKGFELGLLRSMELAEQSATRKMRRMLDRLARVALMASGMSVAEINRQAGQFQGGASVAAPSWASTVPPSRGGGGGGRLLPPGPTFAALGGTAFGSQKYLPTDLSAELKQILRGAAFAFVDAIRTETRSVRIGVGASMQAALPASRIAGLLPAGVGRTPSRYATGTIGGETREQMLARRTQEAYTRSGLRSIDIMGGGAGRQPSPYSYAYKPISRAIVPYQAPGALVATGGGGGAQPPQGPSGGGGLGGFGQFGRAMGGVSLPGAGTIRELGTEFSFAAKQVLLFGTAYKALAFIQDFPGQVGQAVGQLQSFRNTLQSVTGNAEMAGQANEFILAAVERYNIPLQSARDGFVKLFASMEPAGFAAGEIKNLFLGITKAAATYGMSADKVDRVNYAFAQMASKGQVMSEELKGQLGDVLPGAMGIFAEAAGFKGPDAIQKFNKALEDGVYKGGAMRELLKNVADGMNKEFGPGAEGAAKTFQGSMNRMQNALASFYESFEPAAIGVVNQVAVPLVGTLKNITEGVNAYFKGQAAANPEAQKFADTLQVLIPAISGIAQNVKVVLGGLSTLGGLFANVALQASRLLALPIVGYLASAYAQVLILSTAFTFLANSAIGTAIAALVRFIAQGIVYAQVTLGMRVATQQTTVAMYQFGTAVQTTMIKSVIGIAIVAISAFIAKIMELRGQLAAISGDAKSMEDMAKASAKLGDVGGTKEAVGNIKERLNTYKQLKKEITSAKKIESGSTFSDRGAISSGIEVSTALAKKLVELGVISANSLSKTAGGYKILEGNLGEIKAKIDENISGFERAGQKGNDYINKAIAANQKLKQQSSMQGGGVAEDGRQRKVPLSEVLDMELPRQQKMREADVIERLNERIRDAKKQGNEYEAESLESTREAIRLGTEVGTLKSFVNMLIDKENILVGKTLTQKGFDNKLEDAKVQLYVRQKELTEALAKIRDKEGEQQKKIREEQERFASTLIDIKFENGFISTQEYNRLKIDQEIAKILKEFPSLTKQQKDEIAGVIRSKQTQLRIVKEEIELLRATNDIERRRIELQREGYSETKIKEIIDLEKVRDNIKTTRQLIDNFVTDTSSDYKGFLKAVISGEDAVDALEKFQAGLKDRVLTIFLDFTMKPVEDFFKNVVGGKLIETLFPKTEEEKKQEAAKTPIDANTEATKTNTTAIDNLTAAINGAGQAGQSLGGMSGLANSTGFASYADGKVSDVFANSGISVAGYEFGQSSEGINMAFKDINESTFSFSENLNANADNIANATKGLKENGTNFMQGLGGVVQGIGMLAGSAMGIVAGIKQIQKGDTSSVLGGIGSILMGVGGGILGFGKLFGANGGVATGGWKPLPVHPFANGGMVQGPTLGLIGEGKYNEAIVPLPDGRSIPVQMQGDSVRDKMNSSGNGGAAASPILSMNFETTTINNVEYVSREQLEKAMMETRRLATRDGAKQGASLAIDKIQQSPNTRRRIGI